MLASLNHPHIAAIYGVEQAGDTRGLVLELVEGDTLAERLGRPPDFARGASSGKEGRPLQKSDVVSGFSRTGFPMDEAFAIAKQIAEALEAAHEQGIIHRDLKPSNIKITPDGVVKVLDFGLAKLTHARAGTAGALSMSPTITSPAMTGAGVILGTAAYMAPEQAKGREADKRSDVWAFGCVLYEMLTGRRAFDGEDATDVIAAIMRGEPDWNALPADVPVSIRTLLQRCLEKDRRRRIADISTAHFLLSEPESLAGPSSAPVAGAVVSTPRPLWRRAMPMAATLVVGSVITGSIIWFAIRSTAMPPRVSRLSVNPPSSAALSINGVDRDLALTPDASRVIYVGNNGTQLFVRALDTLEPVVVFKGATRAPFVSPDGQWIGFVENNNVLRKVAVTGGPPVTLATLDNTSRGATWGPDDRIIFATGALTTGLQRVAAAGGPTDVITRPDRAQGELDHLWPEMLPGGRAVLFTITALTGGPDAAQVAVLDLQTGAHKILVRGGSHARYVPSGHLMYAAAGTLLAVPFDLARLETRGTAVPVISDVVTTGQGGVDAVVAADGTLVYISGGVGAGAQRTLLWVDRQGRETPIAAPPRAYVYPRLSPDGTRAAVWPNDQEADIWLWDLGRTTLTRVTFDPAGDIYPVWTPDGRRLLFSSERAGTRNLFWQAADGTGSVERLTESPNLQNAVSVSPDGMRLIFTETAPKTREDVMQVELHGNHRVAALVQTGFNERNGVVSPDGRWLAYEADDSGQVEIYVRPFPDVNSGHWQVSTGGGTRPLWARNGQELFYLSPAGIIMRVGVERSQSWSATTPTALFKTDGYFVIPGGNPGRTYDISPDGQRFLMVKQGGGTGQTAAPPSLIVVQNFAEELKRLVPTR